MAEKQLVLDVRFSHLYAFDGICMHLKVLKTLRAAGVEPRAHKPLACQFSIC